MAEELALGIRHNGERRHGNGDRRVVDRGTADRRRRDRRRATLRSLAFTALACVFPPKAKSSTLPFFGRGKLTPAARVTSTIDSFEPIPPPRAYDELIDEAAQTFGVSPRLIRSVMQTESGFDPSAVSRVGAMGLMQLMPDIADAYGVENPFDPRENIMAGTQILRELLDLYRGDLTLTLASYNAGAGVVQQYGGVVPPFAETQNYVKRVTGLMARNADD